MKTIAILITVIFPLISFAGSIASQASIDAFQEQCAKEQDPVKRQNACHILDKHAEPILSIPEYHQETVTV